MSVGVRRAELVDWDEAKLLVDEYCRTLGIVLTDDAATFRAYFEDGGALWLARDGSQPVGCVALRSLEGVGTKSGEVKRLYVRSTHRRAGIADALMDALEAFATSQGYATLYLDTKDDLDAAITLYERRGYERVARYNDNPQATIFLRRVL